MFDEYSENINTGQDMLLYSRILFVDNKDLMLKPLLVLQVIRNKKRDEMKNICYNKLRVRLIHKNFKLKRKRAYLRLSATEIGALQQKFTLSVSEFQCHNI